MYSNKVIQSFNKQSRSLRHDLVRGCRDIKHIHVALESLCSIQAARPRACTVHALKKTRSYACIYYIHTVSVMNYMYNSE